MYPERVRFQSIGQGGKFSRCWVTFICFSIDCPLNRLRFFTGDVLQSQIVQELTECRRVSRAEQVHSAGWRSNGLSAQLCTSGEDDAAWPNQTVLLEDCFTAQKKFLNWILLLLGVTYVISTRVQIIVGPPHFR